MKAWRQFATVWILVLWSAPAPAIGINDFTAARNDRFASGYSNGPLVANTDPSFIGTGYDWSGVGWDARMVFRGAVLRPDHAAANADCQPLSGRASATPIQFVSATGQVTTVTVQSATGIAFRPSGGRPMLPTWPRRS